MRQLIDRILPKREAPTRRFTALRLYCSERPGLPGRQPDAVSFPAHSLQDARVRFAESQGFQYFGIQYTDGRRMRLQCDGADYVIYEVDPECSCDDGWITRTASVPGAPDMAALEPCPHCSGDIPTMRWQDYSTPTLERVQAKLLSRGYSTLSGEEEELLDKVGAEIRRRRDAA